MLIADIIRQLSVIVIIFLCIVVLQGLSALYYQTKEWRFISLMLIPFSFCVLYIWIGIFSLSPETARDYVRSVIIFSLFVSLHVVFTYLGKLRRSKLKRVGDKVKNADSI